MTMGTIINLAERRSSATGHSGAEYSPTIPATAPATFKPSELEYTGRLVGEGSPLHERWHRWRKAEIYLDYVTLMYRAASSADTLWRHHDVKECEGLAGDARRHEYHDKIDAAKAVLILTPVHHKTDLARKRKCLKEIDTKKLNLSPAKIAAVLAADEEYLAIAPRWRPRALAEKAARS